MNRKRRGITMVEVAALSGMLSLLASVAVPSIFQARESARSTQCRNNLFQHALAMHNYHDVFNTFPPGWVQHSWEADEGDAWGWGTFLTPYLDHAPRYNMIDFHVPPSQQDPRMIDAILAPIEVYRCPADESAETNPQRGDWPTSNYAINFGSQPPPRWEAGGLSGVWPGAASTPKEVSGIAWCNSSCRIARIPDGTSYTLMMGERSPTSGNATWVGVRGNQFEYDTVSDLSRHTRLNSGPGSFSSPHEGGVHFAFADGSVRFLSDRINDSPPADSGQSLLEKASNRNDGEAYTDEEYRLLEGGF